MPKGLFLLMALAALGGCGKANEKAFDDGFNKNFRSSCITSASQGGVPAPVANQICDCAIAKIGEKFSGMEKLTISEEQMNPIMTECVNSVVQK